MKILCQFLGMALASVLVGCASSQISLSTVGPNPADPPAAAGNGRLEVYSARQIERDGNEFSDDPIWYQHSDYKIYDLNGNLVRHVQNATGEYAEAPVDIPLPPGKYSIRSRAKGYLQLTIPVVIKPGLTTRVHLDGQWTPPAPAPAKVVKTPNGYPVGWKSD